jgi:hypothetical protein
MGCVSFTAYPRDITVGHLMIKYDKQDKQRNAVFNEVQRKPRTIPRNACNHR